MRYKNSKARKVNGVVSAAIVIFFVAHGVLGSLSGLVGLKSPFTWFVWVGVALVGVHVAVSVITSKEQLADKVRPPSVRKKRHLALKWATGGLLALAAASHIVAMSVWGPEAVQSSVTGAAIMVVLAVVLAVHLCVGSKSLLKDLGIDRGYMTAFRIVVCALCAFFAISSVAGMVV